MPRLVTTALPETLDEKQDIVLLGEWGRLYGSGDIARENAPVVCYHWDDREKLARDFEYLQSLNRHLLKNLSGALNELHGVSFSERYWELLLGYWLNLFTSVLFDRWSCLNEAVAQYDDLKTVVYPISLEKTVPNDTSEALHFFLTDWWNHVVFGRLMSDRLEIETVISEENGQEDLLGADAVRGSQANSFFRKRLVMNSLSRFLGFSAHWNRYAFVRSGLPFKQEVLLDLRLGCIPSRTKFPSVKPLPLNPDLRQWTICGASTKGSFEALVRTLIPDFIPKVFVEGFQTYQKPRKWEAYPDRTKAIFTSNSHFQDDAFKFWAAEQRERGSRLVIGQHGGGAFHKFNGATSYELSICDAYVSSGDGNCDADPRVRDVGRFNNKFKKDIWDPDGYATLVTVAMPRYSFDVRAMPMAGQMLQYFEDQFRFYEQLTEKIRERMQIRIYPKGDYGWNQKQRWLDRLPQVSLDEGQVSLANQAAHSRLMISTYNATTYNESLAANVPTVMYWNPTYWEISDSARLWYDELKAVGIFHETPESAAEHVVRVWDDVGGWWNSAEVQDVRARYCRRYAHLPPDVMSRLSRTIKGIAQK